MNSGYNGYSMSKRATEAYNNGEMPLSKWTKSNIIEAIKTYSADNKVNFSIDLIKKVKLAELKELVLVQSSWHHTSLYINKTDFYSLNEEKLETLTDDDINAIIGTKKTDSPKVNTFRGDIKFLTWSGSRNHSKATETILKDVNIEKKGSFYYATDDSGKLLVKKKIDSNGTYVINYKEEQLKKEKELYRAELTKKYSNPAALDVVENEWNSKIECSGSGHVYKLGRKPSRYDHDRGLSNFFEIGEKRVIRDSYRYDEGAWDFVWTYTGVETWNGHEWVSTN